MKGEGRRRTCNELAELLRDPETLRAVRLLQRTELLAPRAVAGRRRPSAQGAAEDPSARTGEGPRRISIWRPQERPGGRVFVRPEPGPFGDHYAARREIPAAKPPGVRRLCLFGESVAAGYLYAPHRTPAMVLEEGLGTGWEVIDLARTNETLAGWVRKVEASCQLSPDVFVFFGGNNWNLLETPELSPYLPSVHGRQILAEALAQGGIPRLRELARERLERVVRRAFRRVAEVARQHSVPVFLVVPEVNLADWESRQPVAWLPGDGVARWYRWLRRGEALLARGDAAGSATLARRMIELDGGLCPTSHRLLARALMAQGEWAAAGDAGQAEVDAESYATLGFLGAPRATSLARSLALEGAREWGFRTVDLRRIFRETLEAGGEVPLAGRRFFLDYCHLTAEGTDVAMGALATAVLADRTGEGAAHSPPPGPRPTPPSPAAEATARLGAAVHTAHRWAGDKRGLLEHWCRRALEATPEAARSMVDLVQARCAGLPAVLTQAQRRNSEAEAPFGFQHGWCWKGLDAEVLGAILAILGEGGGSEAEDLRRCLVEGLGVGGEPTELLQERFLWDPLMRSYPEVMSLETRHRRGTFRSLWPVSTFTLIARGGTGLELDLCARLPAVEGASDGAAGSGPVALKIDGEPFAEVSLVPRWRRQVSTGRVPAGKGVLHRLSLEWPMPRQEGDAALARVVERLESGIEADLHPVFGEVWSLRARAL